MPDDQAAAMLDRRLHVVMLVEPSISAVLHAARVGVGEVILVLGPWPWCGRAGRPAARRAAGTPRSLLAFAQLGLIGGLLGSVALLGPRFEHGLGLGQPRQSHLPARNFVAHDHAVGHPALISLLGQGEQRGHFRSQVGVQFEQAMLADGLTL